MNWRTDVDLDQYAATGEGCRLGALIVLAFVASFWTGVWLAWPWLDALARQIRVLP